MKEQDEFYIGWQDEASDSFKGGRKTFFLIGMIVFVLFVAGYLFMENKFVDSYFDYGNLTELEGTIVEYPVFGLRTEIDGKAVTVPLVGFGKFDALPVLAELKEQANGTPLSNLNVSLEGTLITYQGKVWMELADIDPDISNITFSDKSYIQTIKNLGIKRVNGEIVDPKCFFGVMNPAYNKIHRSCAIRCISGGIPPMLAIRENDVFVDYYFVIDEKGEPVNKEVLPFVGISISLSGEVQQVDDWKVVRINTEKLSQTIYEVIDGSLAFCN